MGMGQVRDRPPHTAPPAHVSTNSQSHQPIATIRLAACMVDEDHEDGEGELVQKGAKVECHGCQVIKGTHDAHTLRGTLFAAEYD